MVGKEPGNQLAGVHGRWASPRPKAPFALYFQLTGEDEAGDLPSKLIGLLGVETWGTWKERWSYRVHMEATDTACSFTDDPPEFNCAYNHGIYQTGYRYRGRAIGHGVEQDAQAVSVGLMVVEDARKTWWQIRALLARLNRGGAPDASNTLTSVPQDLTSVEISHQRDTSLGRFLVGLGLDHTDTTAPGSENGARGFVRWQRRF